MAYHHLTSHFMMARIARQTASTTTSTEQLLTVPANCTHECPVGIHEHLPLRTTTLSTPVRIREASLAQPATKWHPSTFINCFYPTKPSASQAARDCVATVFDETHVVLVHHSTTFRELDQELRLRYRDSIERIFRECRAGELSWVYYAAGKWSKNAWDVEERICISEDCWETVKRAFWALDHVKIELVFSIAPLSHASKNEQAVQDPDSNAREMHGQASGERSRTAMGRHSKGKGYYPMNRTGL